jgi:hypothetical protein
VTYFVVAVAGAVAYAVIRSMLSQIKDKAKEEQLLEILQKQQEIDRKRAEEMMKDKSVDQVADDLDSGLF